jgi:hypothetical protein
MTDEIAMQEIKMYQVCWTNDEGKLETCGSVRLAELISMGFMAIVPTVEMLNKNLVSHTCRRIAVPRNLFIPGAAADDYIDKPPDDSEEQLQPPKAA